MIHFFYVTGMKGRIYNILETSIFGINVREETNAINEIVFNPKINYLFAAAHEGKCLVLILINHTVMNYASTKIFEVSNLI